MSIFDTIRSRARSNPKIIALPEHDDERVLEAARIIRDNKIARLLLVGKEHLKQEFTQKGDTGIEVVNPSEYPGIDQLADLYYQLRKHKGMTPQEASQAVRENYLLFSFLLARTGKIDGVVAGASHTTPDVLRMALQTLPRDESIGTISGSFIMELPGNPPLGEQGVFVFADCGVNPDPSPRQLVGIARASALTFRQIVGTTPKVAFLSYSSKGSAEGPTVEKVREAAKKIKEVEPDLLADGELQLDSAIVPEVAKKKCAGSPVAGYANVLIFPNLDAGNITYKIVQRMARARAVGPILQGFTCACSDLSRGCDADDVVDAVAVTALRSYKA